MGYGDDYDPGQVGSGAAGGRATRAALRALVEAIGVRRRGLTLKTGAAGRDKLVLVEDPPEDLAQRVAALMKASR
jgi:uncharacterized protein YggU (UPF0235/DUF167 family)